MCASETYSKFRAGKDLPHTYPIQYGLKRGDAFQVSCPGKPGGTEIN
jgi:hypothetical protein